MSVVKLFAVILLLALVGCGNKKEVVFLEIKNLSTMTNAGRVQALESSIRKVTGVDYAKAHSNSGTITVRCLAGTELGALHAAVAEAGFTVVGPTELDTGESEEAGELDDELGAIDLRQLMPPEEPDELDVVDRWLEGKEQKDRDGAKVTVAEPEL